MAVVAMAMLAGASTASASSSTGNDNPTLLVSASLNSNGANPDVAVNGNWISASLSVQNTSSKQYARIFLTVSLPTGAPYSTDFLTLIPAGKTRMLSVTFPVLGFLPRGDYSISIAALGAGYLDPSAATASITIA